jgi:hypothetical protein
MQIVNDRADLRRSVRNKLLATASVVNSRLLQLVSQIETVLSVWSMQGKEEEEEEEEEEEGEEDEEQQQQAAASSKQQAARSAQRSFIICDHHRKLHVGAGKCFSQ